MIKLIKNIFITSILFVIVQSITSAEVINKLKVEGNERISEETIAVFGDIVIGSNYEPNDVNLLIKKLYESNFFSNISAEINNGVLSIFVSENPIIQSVELNGESARKYIKKINELILLKEKNAYVKNNLKSDINIIKEFYRSLGFYFVNIDVDMEMLEKNRVNIIYTIDKGKKASIAKIHFLGEKKVRDLKLRDIITSQVARPWKFISQTIYLNKGRVELDKRLLENYYKNIGYYEVEISSSNVEYSEGEGFVLTFSIDAGKRYKFKKIYADVSPALDKSSFFSLEKEFDKVIGDYYSQRKLTSILEKIDELSESKELQFINHGVEETLIDNGVEVKINIFEDQKFTIERINIVGNAVTNDSVIRGELAVDEGDPYSVLLVNKSINKLRARNLFANINKKVSEGSTFDQKILEISVEEKATGEISAGAGVGTDGTTFMFAIKENNWLGKGVQVDTSVAVSQEKITGNLGLVDPNYNFSGNAVFADLNLSSTDTEATTGYKSQKTGASLGTQFEQYENIYLAPSFAVSYEEITTSSTASAAIKKQAGTYSNADFMYSIISDQRNQSYGPTSGYRAHFEQTLPLILDSAALSNTFNLTKYHLLSDNVIGTIKFQARSINGLNDEDVRLSRRLYIPKKRLRGFETMQTGPKDGKSYVGGNYSTAFGLEAKLPNLLPEATKTDISIFIDTANLWGVDYNSDIGDSNKIKSSIGISADVSTVVGPLSFTIAQDITKASTDKTQFFNFGLGTSF
jgi:outer membrane protein insertion porin family